MPASPGLALGVGQDGRPVHLAGFGLADDGGRAFTPRTPFFIGSNSKSFTALAVMQLAEAGVERLTRLLCTTMWITCVKRRRACAHIGELLGIVLPGRARNRALTWESAIHALCIEKKTELSTRHAAIAHK